MHIQLNGSPTRIGEQLTARELLEQLDLAGKRVAVEVNGVIVPRSCHHEYTFQDGDEVEIVHAIGGG